MTARSVVHHALTDYYKDSADPESMARTLIDNLIEETGMAQVKRPIGESELGAGDGINMATHQLDLLLSNTYSLYGTARELAQRDASGAELAEWVDGWFWLANPHTTSESDRGAIEATRDGISRNEYAEIDWAYVAESLAAE